MAIVSSLGIVFVLSITVAIPACAPPTPKVERPAPSSHRESGRTAWVQFGGLSWTVE